jgi:hypothetical protein
MSDTTIAQSSSTSGGRTMFAVRAILVLAAVLALLGFALFGLGDEPEVTELPTSTPAASGVDETDGLTSPDEASTVPVAVTYEVFLDRDPFEPVVEEEILETQTAVDGSATDGQPTTDPDPTATPVAPVGGTGSDGPRCSGTEEVVCDGQVVSLIDTSVDGDELIDGDGDLAIVQVGTIVYEASVGRTFAENLELLAIDGDCASLRYGEEQFRICVPGEVLK